MKIIGLVGSNREGGNTEILVREALFAGRESGADVTELIKLGNKTIYPCNGCETCKSTGNCKINDDMQEIYAEMLEADGLIIGTPVYFWNVSGQIKVFIDRTYALLHERRLRNKVGGTIVVSTRAGCSSAFLAMNSFFLIQRMRVAGGAICYGAKKGEVSGDKRGLGEVRALGKLVAGLIK